MYIFRNNDAVPWEKCVATIGFFDGVHGGHRYLLNELNLEAKREKCTSVLITFDEHPRKVLHSDFQPKLLTTLEEKLEQLAGTNIDACVVLSFTEALSRLSAYDFIKFILRDKYHVKTLVVGYDHRFGYNREDGFTQYKHYGEELGMNILQSDKFTMDGIEHFSSTEIRTALHTGNIVYANRLLTYPYTFIAKVIGGFKKGTEIGFPTANLRFESKEKIIPALGVYAVSVYVNNKAYKGMMNIGYRPTFSDDKQISMEVHIIDFDEDIYNLRLKVELVARIRDEMKFSTVDELITQLKKDKLLVNKIL